MHHSHINTTTNPRSSVSLTAQRATQRQWNQSTVKALTSQIDATLASQQRELPLSIDLTYNNNNQKKNFSPPPPGGALSISTSVGNHSPMLSSSSSSHSPVRLQWSPPSLESLRTKQQQQTVQQQQREQNHNIDINTTSSLSEFPSFFIPNSHVQQSKYDSSKPKALMSPPPSSCTKQNKQNQHHHHNFEFEKPLISPSKKSQSPEKETTAAIAQPTTNNRPKVKFEQTKPSFFLPVRGGSDHHALDSISMKQIHDAIEECPSRERRLAAQKALSGTVLDRQKTVFSGSSNNNNNNHNTQRYHMTGTNKNVSLSVDVSAIPSNATTSSFVDGNVSTTIISSVPPASSSSSRRNHNGNSCSSVYLGRDQLLGAKKKQQQKSTTNDELEEITLSPLRSEERTGRQLQHDRKNEDDEDLDAALEQACRDLEQNKN